MNSLDQYLALLEDRGKTCILMSGGRIIFESDSLGVKPLRMLRSQNFRKAEGQPLILIDRVIGKGALMLAELLGVDAIYTPLASEKALHYSKTAGIPLHYKELVPFIENRLRSGMCPIEHSVQNTEDPVLGEQNIEAAIARLMQA